VPPDPVPPGPVPPEPAPPGPAQSPVADVEDHHGGDHEGLEQGIVPQHDQIHRLEQVAESQARYPGSVVDLHGWVRAGARASGAGRKPYAGRQALDQLASHDQRAAARAFAREPAAWAGEFL